MQAFQQVNVAMCGEGAVARGSVAREMSPPPLFAVQYACFSPVLLLLLCPPAVNMKNVGWTPAPLVSSISIYLSSCSTCTPIITVMFVEEPAHFKEPEEMSPLFLEDG